MNYPALNERRNLKLLFDPKPCAFPSFTRRSAAGLGAQGAGAGGSPAMTSLPARPCNKQPGPSICFPLSSSQIMKSEVLRVTHELQAMKDKIKENSEKIKVNKTLPYLVSNVIEVCVYVEGKRGVRGAWRRPVMGHWGKRG